MENACETSFKGRFLLTSYQNVIFATICALLALSTVIANLIVIIGLTRERNSFSTVNQLFCFLSSSDLCMAIFSHPLTVVLFAVYGDKENCALEQTVQFLALFFGHLSGFVILVIAVERYIHTKYPLQYQRMITKTRLYLMLLLCTAAAISFSISYILSIEFKPYHITNFICKVVDLFALSVIFGTYIDLYRHVVKHAANAHKLRSNQNMPAYLVAVQKTLLMIGASLFFCYAPYVIGGIVMFFVEYAGGIKLSSGSAFVIYITYLLVYFNSLINAVIIIYRNHQLRGIALNMFKIFSSKNTSVGPAEEYEARKKREVQSNHDSHLDS